MADKFHVLTNMYSHAGSGFEAEHHNSPHDTLDAAVAVAKQIKPTRRWVRVVKRVDGVQEFRKGGYGVEHAVWPEAA